MFIFNIQCLELTPVQRMCGKQDGEWFDGCLNSYTIHFYFRGISNIIYDGCLKIFTPKMQNK